MRESTLKKAFVGSKDETPEIWRLLLQCGAESLADVASRPIPPGAASFDLVSDDRATLNVEEYRTLLETISADGDSGRKLIMGSDSGPHLRFIEQIAASGKRVHSCFLFRIASAFQSLQRYAPSFKVPELRYVQSLSSIFGRQGRWLSETGASGELRDLIPLLLPREVFESSSEEETARIWREGSDDERVVVLKRLRGSDPARGLELLRENWKKIKKSGYREACLEALRVGLSENDVEFLQGLEKKTRDPFQLKILRDLLAGVPTSNYAQKTLERVETFLKEPDLLSKLGTTDEERAHPLYEEPDVSTLRGAFFALGRVPLAKWEELLLVSPSKIRARLLDAAELPTFSQGALRSFSLFGGSDDWFEFCCESFADVFRLDSNKNYKDWTMLYTSQPTLHHATQQFLETALATGRADYFQRLRDIWQEETAQENRLGTRVKFEHELMTRAFRYGPYPWSEEFARVLCEILIEQISSREQKVEKVRQVSNPNALPAGEQIEYRIAEIGLVENKVLLAWTIAYSPRALRKEFRYVATKENNSFTPDENFIKIYSDACAWRERFDRLFGTQKG